MNKTKLTNNELENLTGGVVHLLCVTKVNEFDVGTIFYVSQFCGESLATQKSFYNGLEARNYAYSLKPCAGEKSSTVECDYYTDFSGNPALARKYNKI